MEARKATLLAKVQTADQVSDGILTVLACGVTAAESARPAYPIR